VGDDLYFRLLYDVIFSISGVIDVTQLFVDTSPGPSVEQNVTIGTRQVALLDTANMTVAEA
jgi:hypothetical protein